MGWGWRGQRKITYERVRRVCRTELESSNTDAIVGKEQCTSVSTRCESVVRPTLCVSTVGYYSVHSYMFLPS